MIPLGLDDDSNVGNDERFAIRDKRVILYHLV